MKAFRAKRSSRPSAIRRRATDVTAAEKPGFFITGTDTGVGKTLVAVALTRALVARGLRTAVMKPVAAGGMQHARRSAQRRRARVVSREQREGAVRRRESLVADDARVAAPGGARTMASSIGHERIRGRAAAARARRRIWCWSRARAAGSRRSPPRETMADIAGNLALPVVLVVGMRLGCLNHALLTREAHPRARPAVRGLDRQQAGHRNAAGQREYRDAERAVSGRSRSRVVPADAVNSRHSRRTPVARHGRTKLQKSS